MTSKPLLYGPDNRPIPARRNYDAAKGTRYTSDWTATAGNADKFLKSDIPTIRDRARDMERNDGYAVGIMGELESNVIGKKGIMMKPLARKADGRNKGGLANKLDVDANEKISAAWDDFSKLGKFEVTRKQSRPMFERLVLRSIVRDGGFLVRLVDGFPNNDFSFAAQGWEMDCLDPRYTDEAKRIFMSIEFDEWDAEVAFHVLKRSPKSSQRNTQERARISSENMLHLFVTQRINQSQGVSWLAPAMLRLRHLSKFEEAEVIAARISANKLGFFERKGESQYTGEEDEEGNIMAPSAPGEFETLPYGVEAKMIDPSHPNANYPDFRKAILRGVCASFPTNYNTVARDLEGVSYSSIRQGVLSERDLYGILQEWFIDTFEGPLYHRWLRMALFMGKIEGYSIADFDRLAHVEFSGRTWAWVDPLKDIEAYEREVGLGINSRQRIARDRGQDFTKIVAENEEDVGALEAAGLPTGPATAPAPTEVDDEEEVKPKKAA